MPITPTEAKFFSDAIKIHNEVVRREAGEFAGAVLHFNLAILDGRIDRDKAPYPVAMALQRIQHLEVSAHELRETLSRYLEVFAPRAAPIPPPARITTEYVEEVIRGLVLGG
jgi:hypothetical protein